MARPHGVPNKATTKAHEAFQALLDERVDKLGELIDRVAVDDPHKAFTMLMELARYCVPRPTAVALGNDREKVTVSFVPANGGT